MNSKNILKIILIMILGMIILRCNNEKEYFTEEGKYDYHILKDGEYGCGSIFDLEPIKDVDECKEASKKFSNTNIPSIFEGVNSFENINPYCTLTNYEYDQHISFNNELCDENNTDNCIDNSKEFYTHTEDNCENGSNGVQLGIDLRYKWKFCPMGKLWRKKHNMDYEVDENDAHLVKVGDKKFFSRYNCAYFLNTGKIRNEGEDLKPNLPDGKEWKAVKWTCTEDCDNIVKKKNDVNFGYNNEVPLGTCHAYTDIKKIDNNNLKCTEDKKCICKRNIHTVINTDSDGEGKEDSLPVYSCIKTKDSKKKCIKNKPYLSNVHAFIKILPTIDDRLDLDFKFFNPCDSGNNCNDCKPLDTEKANEIFKEEGEIFNDINQLNELKNLKCVDFANYDSIEQVYEDCKFELTLENDEGYSLKNDTKEAKICKKLIQEINNHCKKCFQNLSLEKLEEINKKINN